MSEQITSLAALHQASQLLASANTFEEIKLIRDKAEAARKFAESVALGLQMQNAAAELKLQAERKAGEFLSTLSLHGGNRRSTSHDGSLKLADLGINYNQSSRWQREALIPECVFQQYVTWANKSAAEITSQGLLRLAKKLETVEVRDKSSGNGEINPHASNGFSSTECDVTLEILDKQSHSELLAELTNHHELLMNILEPICQERPVELKRIDRRMIKRLLGEIKKLLSCLRPCF